MFKYFWLLLAFVGVIYAISGLVTGEVTFGSTSKINGRELKLYGLAAYIFSMTALSSAVAFGSMGAAEFLPDLAGTLGRVTKIGLALTVFFFLGTVGAVLLK